MRTHRNLLAGVAGSACLTLLASCGVAPPDAAATVGESTISMTDVNDLTTDYCAASERAYETNGVVLPMGTVRRQVMSSLVLREIADQMAEEFDVTPGATYDQAVQATEQQTADLTEARREAALTVDTTGSYLRDIAVASAEADLTAQGVSGLDETQILEKAIDLFATWSDRSPVELNPKFGVTYDAGQFLPTEDGELSVGVSEDATDAAIVERFEAAGDQQEQIELAQQLTGYARTLPATQRCG